MESIKKHQAARLLSLDGSEPGTTELSILIILREIMRRIEHAAQLERMPLPCDWFDMIGGSGMGGVFALLLAVWRLSIDDIIRAYTVLHDKVFTSKAWIEHDLEISSHIFDTTICEIAKSLGKSPDDIVIGECGDFCKAFVCTSNAVNMNRPRLFRTYKARANRSPECTVTEAIFASVAGYPHLKPIELGQPPEQFLSAVHRIGNPSLEVLKEAQEVFGSLGEVACIVSIGTGQQEPLTFQFDGQPDINIFQRIARDPEAVDEELGRRFDGVKGLFYRLNVAQGLDKDLPSSETLSSITTHTEQHLASEICKKKLDALIKDLRERPSKVTLAQTNTLNDAISAVRPSVEDQGLLQLEDIHRFLLPVANAAYDAKDCPVPRRICTADTRVSILKVIEEWVKGTDDRKLYCLAGMAGTGKTTIGKTLCDLLRRSGLLGASFFCSRADQECRDEARIAPTVAFQLAKRFPEYGQELVTAINEPNLVPSFRNLIAAPFHRSSCRPHHSIILVLDALDESQLNSTNSERFVSDLQTLTLIPGVDFKIILTCRPELPFRSFVESPDPSLLILHEVDKDLVQHDIRLFVTERLNAMAAERRQRQIHVDEGWPPAKEVQMLVDCADRFFIYAATVCEYIDGNGQGDLPKRLRWISNSAGKSIHQLSQKVDELYRFILDEAFESVAREEAKELRNLLQVIITAKIPLNADTLASLLKLDNGLRVVERLAPLQSVVHVPSNGLPITTFHASFSDFIFNHERNKIHALNVQECNLFFVHLCFDRMAVLHENMCNIDINARGRINNAEFAPHIIDENIPEPLVYACRFWVDHCCDSGSYTIVKASLHERLVTFFDTQNLPWIECMSLKELDALSVMRKLEYWVSEAKDISTIVQDTRKYISQNNELIRVNSLEVYWSAVAWLPVNSIIRRRVFKDDLHPQITRGLSLDWDACDLCISCTWSVESIALSPDGGKVVSGFHDGTAKIYNAETGVIEVELKGHSKAVTSVAFSPDGRQVVSGSEDKTVRIWNTQTGLTELEYKDHSAKVYSVAFSSNGRIASGSNGSILYGSLRRIRHDSVRCWNAKSGKTEFKLKDHGLIRSLGFSQDGRKLVYVSDGHMKLLDAAAGAAEVSLGGSYQGKYRSVAISANGKRVVSGSEDGFVSIWNAVNGAIEAQLKGHSSWVACVAFSRNGELVVSGSTDRTVRVWNAATGAIKFVFNGHSDSVTSVAFSPDSRQVISGSDDCSIRVWNASNEITGVEEESSFPEVGSKSSGPIKSIAVSPDGRRIASTSDLIKKQTFSHLTVLVWNAVTGVVEAEIKAPAKGLAFSHDSERVAFETHSPAILTGVTHQIQIRNAATGVLQATVKNNTSLLAFSPDDRQIMSLNGTAIQISNVTTGKSELKITRKAEHSGICSANFSPDGKHIVTCTYNRDARIYSTVTGELTISLTIPIGVAGSVFFSPNDKYVVSRSDGTIKFLPCQWAVIWNFTTGQMEFVVESDVTAPVVPFIKDREWLLFGSKLRNLWIPPAFRVSLFEEGAISKRAAAFGYQNGNVLIIKCPETRRRVQRRRAQEDSVN